ncbi:MAG: FAD:protein FMN transferase [Candidatus Aminicenantes bacterium]|nr:FAD:protein FMN transferase [Candidatus Aminicenantes bacterium]
MKFSHYAMGTDFEIFIAGQEEEYARQAAAAVFAEIDRIEGILSRYDPRSDVGQLSLLNPGQSLPVGIELIECLQLAEEVYHSTKGAFDVTLGSLPETFDNKGADPELTQTKKNSACTGFDRFYFAENGAVFFDTGKRRPGSSFEPQENPALNGSPLTITLTGEKAGSPGGGYLNLDFGGIGKGYALDKSLEILSDWDIHRALLHGGASTAIAIGDAPGDTPGDSPAGKTGNAAAAAAQGVTGKIPASLPREKGWPVGLAGETFYLFNRALSGSGKEVKGEHILDPKTGEPACGHRSAWVVHSSAAVADALSTAFVVMQPAEVEAFCAAYPFIFARVIESSGTVKTYKRTAGVGDPSL